MSHNKTLLESLLLNLSGGLVAIGLDGKLTIFNPAATAILHLPNSPYVGKPSSLILGDFPWFTKTLEETLATKATVSRQEIMLPIKGEPTKIGYTTILISDPMKRVLGAGMIFQKLSH